jgi:hypothetical protein
VQPLSWKNANQYFRVDKVVVFYKAQPVCLAIANTSTVIKFRHVKPVGKKFFINDHLISVAREEKKKLHTGLKKCVEPDSKNSNP